MTCHHAGEAQQAPANPDRPKTQMDTAPLPVTTPYGSQQPVMHSAANNPCHPSAVAMQRRPGLDIRPNAVTMASGHLVAIMYERHSLRARPSLQPMHMCMPCTCAWPAACSVNKQLRPIQCQLQLYAPAIQPSDYAYHPVTTNDAQPEVLMAPHSWSFAATLAESTESCCVIVGSVLAP